MDCSAFFVGLDEPATDIEHQVVYLADTDTLGPCSPPVTAFVNDEQPSFLPCAVTLQPVATLAERLVSGFPDDTGEALATALAPNLPSGRSRLGGHCGRDLSHDAYLCSVGKSILYDWHRPVEEVRREMAALEDDGRDERAATLASQIPDLEWYATHRHRHDEEAAHWRVLFEVDSHDPANMLWWDAGQLVFLIDDRDLLTGRFDRTYAAVQSC